VGQQEIYEHETFGEYRSGTGFHSWLTIPYLACKLICAKLLTVEPAPNSVEIESDSSK
jgi:hypothetical protein